MLHAGHADAMIGALLWVDQVSVDLAGGGRRLADVSLELRAGEVGVVVGPRDAGKTTLLGVAGGMVAPDGGRVWLQGRDPGSLPEGERARLVGWACRSGPGSTGLRVLDYVALPLVSRLGSSEPYRRAEAALARFGVGECAGCEWSELCSWQRVGVELAQASARGASLVLVDDLLDGLSLRRAREAMRAVRELARRERSGVLISAADLETGVFGDRLWTLEEGRLCSVGGQGGDRDDRAVTRLREL